jgi:hypothetical protein
MFPLKVEDAIMLALAEHRRFRPLSGGFSKMYSFLILLSLIFYCMICLLR